MRLGATIMYAEREITLENFDLVITTKFSYILFVDGCLKLEWRAAATRSQAALHCNDGNITVPLLLAYRQNRIPRKTGAGT